MEEVFELPDDLLYQLMEQIESNNNHNTNNNDDVEAVENNSSNNTPTDSDLNTTSATRVVTIQRREAGTMIVDRTPITNLYKNKKKFTNCEICNAMCLLNKNYNILFMRKFLFTLIGIPITIS